jgi:hypothetical protein
MQPLRVDADELRRLAAQTGALAGKLSLGSTSMETGSSWLATSAVVTRAHNDVASTRAVFAERMRATSKKLAAAAAAYGEPVTKTV